MAYRTDRTALLSKPQELSDGSIIVEAVLSRAGVFDYGARKEYRDPAEVFSVDSMKSFELMAVTDYHPRAGVDSDDGRVNLDNRTQLQRGSVVPGSIRRDGDLLIGKLHVTDKSLILAMRAGRNQVSCGYDQDVISAGGVAEGQRYDQKQTNIRGNHVAIVDTARAGDIAQARMDSATVKGQTMFKTLEEATAAYQAEKLRADSACEAHVAAKAKLAAESLRADQADAARDSTADKLAASEKLRTDAASTAMAVARARVELEHKAARILTVDGAAPDFKVATDRQIQESVIAKVFGKPVPAGKSDGYVEARFDSALEQASAGDDAMATARTAADHPETGTGVRADAGDVSNAAAKAYAAMVDRNANAWRQAPAKKGA